VTRPAIAVTIENPRQEPEVFRLREDYVRSVETAGGLPLIFAPGRPQDAGEVLDHVGGLLLTGGADVDPDNTARPRIPSSAPRSTTGTPSSSRSAARPCAGTSRSSLSAGAIRC
jgi:gamma-glutamyl-gamma-aminobutyrate hydrolase PuuD